MKIKDFFKSETDNMFEEYTYDILNEISDPDYQKNSVLNDIEDIGLQEMLEFIGIEKIENIIRKNKLKKLLNG